MRFLCCILILLVSVPACPGVPVPAILKRKIRKEGPIRIVVVAVEKKHDVVERLRGLQFQVTVRNWREFDPDREKDCDLILLPTMFAHTKETFAHLEEKSTAFHRFVRQGGALIVCQPNPPRVCTPKLLPYPITFRNSYDADQPARVHLNPRHFLTRGLGGDALPFPADPMIAVDPRYTLLAKQASTGWPSLAVCTFGIGRVVVQTANENRGANIPLHGELLRRMILWSVRMDPPE